MSSWYAKLNKCHPIALEEARFHAHVLRQQPQHRRDRVARRPLRRRARCHHLRRRAAAPLRRRQPVAVDLGAARARPLAHAHHDRWHHVGRQRRRCDRQRRHAPKRHRRAEAATARRYRHCTLCRFGRGLGSRRCLRLRRLAGLLDSHHLRRADVRHERVGVHEHHRLVDARQRAQRVLDLAQLDPLAAQLHLEVEPPAELKLAVGVPAHAVTRAVDDAAARRVGLGPRVGHEAPGGELGPVEVAARHLHAAQPQLAPHADRLQQGR
eukprot:scaffold4170_cov63-Phaeocystis_antarctica.AAC.10